jgi:hypothetical protein
MTGLLPFVQRYSPTGRLFFFSVSAAAAYHEWTDDEFTTGDITAGTALALSTANLLTAGLESALVGVVVEKTVTAAAVPVAAVAVGYTAGAVAGTIIAEQTMGPGAGQMAYDLYTNPRFEPGGILYETADILGNASRIAQHYIDQRFWENNAARPGDVDYQYSGHTRRYAEMYGYTLD